MSFITKIGMLLLVVLSAGSASAATFEVQVGANGALAYSPATLNIKVGDNVVFQYVSGVHPTVSDSSPAAFTQFLLSASNATYTFNPSSVGTYPYHCTVHGAAGPPSAGNMAGVINVTAATPTATTAPVLAGVLNLYPNPSKGLVSVALSQRASAASGTDYRLRLRNILGQEVRTIGLRPEALVARQTLDFSDLPAGLYFYSLLIDNKAVLTKRLTLQ